jgi:hypothetical protein
VASTWSWHPANERHTQHVLPDPSGTSLSGVVIDDDDIFSTALQHVCLLRMCPVLMAAVKRRWLASNNLCSTADATLGAYCNAGTALDAEGQAAAAASAAADDTTAAAVRNSTVVMQATEATATVLGDAW